MSFSSLPYLLLDIDGVLIPFPAADGSTPSTHVRHAVHPMGRAPDDPVSIWLDPAHGPMLTHFLSGGLVAPAWCTSWRRDAVTVVGPLLGLPTFPHLELPRPHITTSHPNGYLWKRDYVESWLGESAVVWVDDDFTGLDLEWAAERTARGHPTLLVQPDPYVGLQEGHLAEIREWAALGGAISEPPLIVNQRERLGRKS
ncbi:HAD domain-containing protein [Streptomyces sp. NPDC046887]|uniref:HAD domain-containing protein n=1 Tax=Streptomyces sp. NPDC046887 TaxID=3155472 RepID=UPI0033FB30FE